MVVATRELSESMPNGSIVLHAVGDHLVRFDSWDYAVQRALRRLGYVEDRDGTTPERADTEPQAAKAGPSCPHCPERSFVNHHGLKLHMTRIHGGQD